MTQDIASFPPLVQEAIEGISDVKGENLVVFNLQGIENSVCDYFVICDGNSNTQVAALCDSVEKRVREQLGERPWHVEGRENSQWILMDFVNVVVHIFQKEARTFYDIESLWNDAEVTAIPA